MRATSFLGALAVAVAAVLFCGLSWAGEDSPHHPKPVAPKDEPKPEAKEGVKDRPRPEGERRERDARERREGREGERREGNGDARARHLREAAAHLREAGMPDLAERLLREAERAPGQKPDAPRDVRRPEGPEAILRQMAQQIEELHRQVRELREQVEQLKRDRK